MNGIEFALPGVNLFNLYQYMVIFFVSSLRISSFLISAPFFSLGGILEFRSYGYRFCRSFGGLFKPTHRTF